MTTYDALVIGGGIVGSAAAYSLSRNGVQTALFDKRDSGRATSAGAGIVSPSTSTGSESEPWFRFASRAADYYPELASELDQHEHSYTDPGVLAVAIDEDEINPFESMLKNMERRSQEYGTPDPGSFETLSPAEAAELYPPLSDVKRALYYRDGGRVDGSAFAEALRNEGQESGLIIKNETVTDIKITSGEVTGVETAGGEQYQTSKVIVAGGAWSASFGDDLGVSLPIEPQRGQIAHLDTDPLGYERPTSEWPIVKAFRHHYQVPWDDGRIACGATRETGAGFEPRVTLSGVREVTTEAERIASGLGSASHLETRVGLRPVSADGLPVLGPVPSVQGAFVATGHGPTGLTLGPYSGKVIADLTRGVEPSVDIAPFRVDRF